MKKNKDTRKVSLVLNDDNDVAYFSNKPFGFIPEWASIDVERGELYFGGEGEEGEPVMLDKIKVEIYEEILKKQKILLVYMDINNPIHGGAAYIVPLMVAHQIDR
jgi:hypothetical protein